MIVLRRNLSILLLVLFALPALAPLLATSGTSEAGLPACCRRNGQHHCAMSMEERSKLSTTNPRYQAPLETCRYHHEFLYVSHLPDFVLSPVPVALAHRSHLPIKVGEAEASARISSQRSHQKRGPPFA